MTADGHWEHFEQGEDVGLRGVAATKGSAFEQAALALTAVTVPPARVQPRASVQIACEASDEGRLLIAWLDALLREMGLRRMVFCRFRVLLDGSHLHAVATGEPLRPDRRQPVVEVTGPTFTEPRVAQRDDGAWVAQTLVDV